MGQQVSILAKALWNWFAELSSANWRIAKEICSFFEHVPVASLGLLIPWAKVRRTRYILDNLTVGTDRSLDEFKADVDSDVTAVGDAATDFFFAHMDRFRFYALLIEFSHNDIE